MNAKELKRLSRREAIIVTEKGISEKLDGYNRLKDNVLYIMDGGKNKVVQIESSISHEAKTTVACNLAVLLGNTDKKVLVLDLDFRRAGVHQLFGIENKNGLAEYMTESATYEEIVKETKYKNVWILPRGAMIYNSSLVLLSDRFKALMAKLREDFDLVIIDTTPVLQMSDYIHVSKHTDATIFLVAYGITKKAQVKDAIAELKKNNVNIIGSVFTFYDPKRSNHYYNYYYKRSGYYYTPDKEKKD